MPRLCLPEQMTLCYTLTENDCLVFTEQYLRGSKSHQALRTRARWALPCLLLVMACYYNWRDGFSFIPLVICGSAAVAWWFFYPRRFDARIRTQAKKQMAEASYARTFGAMELQLLDEHLHSIGPLGSSTYSWSGVDRVTLDSEYLTIFLSGPAGYPIRVAEIGQEAAQRAHDFVATRINGGIPNNLRSKEANHRL